MRAEPLGARSSCSEARRRPPSPRQGGRERRRRSARESGPRRRPRRGVRRRARRRAARAGDPGRDALAIPARVRIARRRVKWEPTRACVLLWHDDLDETQPRVLRRRDRAPERRLRRRLAEGRRPGPDPVAVPRYDRLSSAPRRRRTSRSTTATRRARLVRMSSRQGGFTLVTFLYTHCPDVCPLIAEHLNTALRRLRQALRRHPRSRLAASVDPKGDTPAAVRRFVAVHHLLPQFRYLSGSAAQAQGGLGGLPRGLRPPARHDRGGLTPRSSCSSTGRG